MPERTQTRFVIAFNAALLFCISGAVFFLLRSVFPLEPFGHDEAVYLLKARSWLEGTPAEEWEIYRPIAMSVYAWIIFHFDNSIITMRMFGVFFGAVAVSLTFLFFRQLTNLWIALATIAVIATSTLFLEEAPLFRNDVPAAAFLIAILWLIYIHFRSSGKSNSIYLVAPLSALAFYTRYGVATTLAIIGVSTFLLMFQRFIKQENHEFKRILRTLLFAVALFIPFFITSKFIMGDFLGILQYAGSAAHPPEYFGEALIQYIRWMPFEIGGIPLTATAIIGAIATPFLLGLERLRQEYFHIAWTGSIGLGAFITTSLLTHADPRYVFFPLVLLCGTGIACIYYAVARLSHVAAFIAIGIVFVFTLYLGIGQFQSVDAFYTERASSPTSVAYADVYAAILASSPNGNCSIWLVEYLPKASWITRCSVYAVTNPEKFLRDKAKHPENVNYSIVNTKLDDAQIQESSKDRFNVDLTEIFRSSKLSSGDLILYRIDERATTTQATTTTQAATTTAI